MKKILLTLGLGLTLFSCKKEDIKPNTVKHTVTFGGYLSVNGTVTINGVVKSLSIPYDVKVGDVLRFDDTGADIVHPDIWLYPSGNGGSPLLAQAGWTEQGETCGIIIVDGGSAAQQLDSYSDIHLKYIVK